jgi:TolB-like protein
LDSEASYFYSVRYGEINWAEIKAYGNVLAQMPSVERVDASSASFARTSNQRAGARRVAHRVIALAMMIGIAACAARAPKSGSTSAAPKIAAAPAPVSTPARSPGAAAPCTRTPLPSAATVAVADFEGGSVSPDKGTEFWRRALATFMIADLACSNNLRLVDREHLAAILREQRLSASDLSDPATRMRVGKILGARYFIFGTYTIVGGGAALTARMDSVETGQIIEAKSVSGNTEQMRGLSQNLAADFLASLNQTAAFKEARSASGAGAPPVGAAAYYDQGLIDEQHGDYGRAIDEYVHALALDPSFRQARERLEKASESAARQ